jgi:hypothetical protein
LLLSEGQFLPSMIIFTWNEFCFQVSISPFHLSFNIIISVKMTLNVSVFTMKTISVFVKKIIIVPNVLSSMLNMIIVPNVYLEENVFKVI